MQVVLLHLFTYEITSQVPVVWNLPPDKQASKLTSFWDCLKAKSNYNNTIWELWEKVDAWERLWFQSSLLKQPDALFHACKLHSCGASKIYWPKVLRMIFTLEYFFVEWVCINLAVSEFHPFSPSLLKSQRIPNEVQHLFSWVDYH